MKRISLTILPALLFVSLGALAGSALSSDRSASVTCGYIATTDTFSTVINNVTKKTKNYSWQPCPYPKGAGQTQTLILSTNDTAQPTSLMYGLNTGSCSASNNILKVVVTPMQTAAQLIEVTSNLGYTDAAVSDWNGANQPSKKLANGSYDGFATPGNTSLHTITGIKGNTPYTIMWLESCQGSHTFNFKAK